MRVAVVTGDLSSAAGGLASSVPALCARLSDRDDVEVDILGIRDPHNPYAWREWGPSVHPHTRFGPRPLQWAPALGATLRRLAPDIVDMQGLWTYGSRLNLAYHRDTNHPYMITPRGMLDPWSLEYSRWKKRVVAHWYETEHLAHARCLRATAALEATHFRAYGLRQPIAVVPNPIEIPPTDLVQTGPKGLRRLLFLSRLHPKKGLPFLLRAWKRLQVDHGDWELVIGGPDEGGHRSAMKSLARDLELRRIQWLDPVHGDAKSRLYASADLFVLPTHAENFGLVIAEALAHGCPVVTTRYAPWAALERYGCGWSVELDTESLWRTLSEAMVLEEAERREMGLRGRRWMKRDFAAPALADQLHETYRWMLGGNAPPPWVITD